MSWGFVGCLEQARKRCTNRWCCGPRNYASDVRPTDPLAAGVESPSQILVPGVVFCTATAGLKYIFFKKPSDRGRSSLVRHVKCSTSLYMIFDVMPRRCVQAIGGSLPARHYVYVHRVPVGTNSPALPAKRGCRGWQSRVYSGPE